VNTVSPMRVFLAMAVLLSSPMWAQIRGGPGGGGPGRGGARGPEGHGGGHGPGIRSGPAVPRTFTPPSGYGNVVFPGTGGPPGMNVFSPIDPSFGTRLGNTVSGAGVYGGGYGYGYGRGYGYSGYGGRRRPYGNNTVIVPYPVYVPYGYAEPAPEEPPPPPPPQIIYVVPGEPDRGQTTTVPPPAGPGVVTYIVPSRPPGGEARSDDRKLYLIAFKNYSIYSATDYWLEGDALHYLTPYGSHNQASLDQVDLEFTERLNRERGLEFRLRN
jgi:hypothetical protein